MRPIEVAAESQMRSLIWIGMGLALTGALAISLSIASFQYYSYTSDEKIKIAAEDIRSNAKIQAH